MGLFIYFVISFMYTCDVGIADLRAFFYEDDHKTKDEAVIYCREKYTDLATIVNTEEAKNVQDLCGDGHNCWIGLSKTTDGVWVWGNGIQTNFTFWMLGQPDNYKEIEYCAVTWPNGWNDVQCSHSTSFICYEDNVVVVKENKTWEDAMEHCRNHTSLDYSDADHHTSDLISLHSSEDQAYAGMLSQAQAETGKVWIGLRFLAGQWLWLDGTHMWYSGLPKCPAKGMECGTVNKDGMMATNNCEEQRNFICSIKSVGYT